MPAAAGALLLAGCGGPFSTLDPAGPAAHSISLLWWIMLIGAAAVFLLVSALLAAVLIRPGAYRAIAPRTWIVWGGVALPGATLVALVLAAFVQGEQLLAKPRAEAPLRIEARARQWAWEFVYPEGVGLGSSDRLHIPAGRNIDFAVTSADVIHSFWIPRLGGKIDAIPGHENVVRLRADRPGIYRGICAEFCGTGHTAMQFTVEAHAPEDYAARLQSLVASGKAGR